MLNRLLDPIRSSARTTTFRVAMAFAGLFAGFAVLLLGILYATTVGRLGIEADQAARRELSDLGVIWSTQGVEGLNMEVIQRAARANDTLYVLVRPNGTVLSGNIDGAPIDLSQVQRPPADSVLDPQSAISNAFSYERPNPTDGRIEKRRARGLFLAGPDGFGLYVARDLGPGVEAADQVAQVIWMGGAGMLAFALVGGFLAARQAAGRVDELSRTTRAVMAGDLGRRAAVRVIRAGEGDEFDDLTEDLNAMLERIDRLVVAARTTGDSIAHDLRSPLTRMRARLENAAMSARNEDDLRDVVDDTLAQLDTVVATFNAVLRLSRLEAGEGGQLAPMDVSLLVVQLADMFEPVVDDKGLKFTAVIEPDLNVLADKSLLAQALSNLLDNAVKYTDTGEIILSAKRVTISDPASSEIELSVSDSGMGIPESSRSYATQRFSRLDSARSLPGTGIGLSLALAIAELHKGRFELRDGLAHEGQVGLTAAIILPAGR
jgi:signal transduction histidine kinase